MKESTPRRAKHHPLTRTPPLSSKVGTAVRVSRARTPPPSYLRSQRLLPSKSTIVPLGDECPVLVIHERLHDSARVHDKGSVPADRLPKRSGRQEDVPSAPDSRSRRRRRPRSSRGRWCRRWMPPSADGAELRTYTMTVSSSAASDSPPCSNVDLGSRTKSMYWMGTRVCTTASTPAHVPAMTLALTPRSRTPHAFDGTSWKTAWSGVVGWNALTQH